MLTPFRAHCPDTRESLTTTCLCLSAASPQQHRSSRYSRSFQYVKLDVECAFIGNWSVLCNLVHARIYLDNERCVRAKLEYMIYDYSNICACHACVCVHMVRTCVYVFTYVQTFVHALYVFVYALSARVSMHVRMYACMYAGQAYNAPYGAASCFQSLDY